MAPEKSYCSTCGNTLHKTGLHSNNHQVNCQAKECAIDQAAAKLKSILEKISRSRKGKASFEGLEDAILELVLAYSNSPKYISKKKEDRQGKIAEIEKLLSTAAQRYKELKELQMAGK